MICNNLMVVTGTKVVTAKLLILYLCNNRNDRNDVYLYT